MKIDKIFEKCLTMTMSKRHDYTSTSDAHENFKRSAEIASWFKSDQDKPYAILIGTKIARLASLLDSKSPNHESIDDTFVDLINYAGLWAERRTDSNKEQLSRHQPNYICYACSLSFFDNPNMIGTNSYCPRCFATRA